MTQRKHRQAPAKAPPPGGGGFSLVSNRKLATLYRTLLACGMLERRLRAEAVGAIPRLRGGHAVLAGVAANLLREDQVCVAGSNPMPEFARRFTQKESAAEDSIRSLLAAICDRGEEVRRGTSWDETLERARAVKPAKLKSAVALFCGLRQTPKEALRRAAKEKLPILFVCQSRRETERLAAVANHCGLPGMVVDCEDAVAIYRVAAEALAHARRGNGPTLMECRRWPVARDGEKPSRASGGAVRAMERYLAGKGMRTEELKMEIQAELERALDKVFVLMSGAALRRAPGKSSRPIRSRSLSKFAFQPGK